MIRQIDSRLPHGDRHELEITTESDWRRQPPFERLGACEYGEELRSSSTGLAIQCCRPAYRRPSRHRIRRSPETTNVEVTTVKKS